MKTRGRATTKLTLFNSIRIRIRIRVTPSSLGAARVQARHAHAGVELQGGEGLLAAGERFATEKCLTQLISTTCEFTIIC